MKGESVSEIENPTPFLRGQDFGQAALKAGQYAAAACASGKATVMLSPMDGFLCVKAWEPPEVPVIISLEDDDAEFLAGVLLTFARRRVERGVVKVPEIQPNSRFGERDGGE